MTIGAQAVTPRLQALKGLSEGLLCRAGCIGVRGHLLEIHHAAAPVFDRNLLHAESEAAGVSIRLSQDDGPDSERRLEFRSGQLPFQDHSFSAVVLHHVIRDGGEEELAEAVRVLAHHGVLLIVGLNCLGWRYRSQDGIRQLPGVIPWRVRARLEALGMAMQGFAGAGLGGARRPAFISSGLAGLAVPLADIVLLQARHRDGPAVTRLRYDERSAPVVQSAPMRG